MAALDVARESPCHQTFARQLQKQGGGDGHLNEHVQQVSDGVDQEAQNQRHLGQASL